MGSKRINRKMMKHFGLFRKKGLLLTKFKDLFPLGKCTKNVFTDKEGIYF